METIKVLNNTEHNGLELYFEKKPKTEILTRLKFYKFKWHCVKKCWFAKNTSERNEFIQTLTQANYTLSKASESNTTETTTPKAKAPKKTDAPKLLALTPLTQEEKMALAKREWNDTEMQDYLLRVYDFYKTTDGIVIEIEKPNKLHFTNTLYYDDETEAPQKTLGNFLIWNRHNCNRYDYYKEKAQSNNNYFYFTKQNNETSCIEVFTDWEIQEDKFGTFSQGIAQRELTDNEKQDILTLYKEQKDKYTERLTKYFNKYKDKITTWGYWANA